jgi:AcrR family transcriptional regulator
MKALVEAATVTEETARGRPRNQQTHDAILDAARALLTENGLARFSIEQVAANAGVSKASIYRRWPAKGALLMELYMEGIPEVISETARSLRTELKRYLLATVERLQDPLWRSILKSLVAESQYDAQTSEMLRQIVIAPRRDAGLRLLERAETSGEIRAGLDHELIVDLLFGPLWYRLLFDHAPVDTDFATRLLKQVEPILYGPARKPTPRRKAIR